MTKSIPIDFVASVTPAVVAAGGAGVDAVGVLLTSNSLPPVGTVASFVTPEAVSAYFGASSAEYAFADQYFQGFDSSPQKPANLLVAQFPLTGVAPYLEGGTLATSLGELTTLAAGTISLDIDGETVTSSSINLSTATSFSQVAAFIQAALSYSDAQATASISGSVMTVTAVTGTLVVGQAVTNAAGTIPTGTTITGQLSGTPGGVGTYQLSENVGTLASAAVLGGALTVSYSPTLDALLLKRGSPGAGYTITAAADGTLATVLKLTANTGAVVSEGSGAAVPGAFMDGLVASTTNWVTFSTLWEPTDALVEAFGAWVSGQNSRYAYVPWSTDTANNTNANATAGAFYAIAQAGYEGVYFQHAPVSRYLAAAFIMGSAASIDFTAEGGRQNFAYLTSPTMPVDVDDLTVAKVLKAKGINFYGRLGGTKKAYSRELFGSITGKFLWMDSYVNQVWLNDALKTALFDVEANTPNIPYTTTGYALVSAALAAPIAAAVSFGAIQPGVELSESQISKVNNLAGADVAATITQAGWALVIKPASATVRAARGSPSILFFYADGQSIQSLSLTSAEVQ